MNPDTLKAIKRQNMKVNNFTSMMKLADKYNTYTYTELIFGLPLETKDTWKKAYVILWSLDSTIRYLSKKERSYQTQNGKKVKNISIQIDCTYVGFLPGAVDNYDEYMDFVVSMNQNESQRYA